MYMCKVIEGVGGGGGGYYGLKYVIIILIKQMIMTGYAAAKR